MTAKQITKKLIAAGFNMSKVIEISRDEVEVSGHQRKAAEILGWHVAQITGYNSYVIRPGQPVEMGDWNDMGSRWHY